MKNAKKIIIIALLLGGLLTLTAFVAIAGNFDKAKNPASVAGDWNGFSLDAKQLLVGNDTSKFPFDTQGQAPSKGNNFAFVQLDAKNEEKSANSNLDSNYFDLQLSDGQTMSVSTAQSATSNHWPMKVEAGDTATVWLVYECPKNVTVAKLQCKQPSSTDKPVVLIQVPQATMILVINNNDSHVTNYYNNTTNIVNVNHEDKTPPPAQCQKPWPSKIDQLTAPSGNIYAGTTYKFSCHMMVQNYDTHCTLSPWWNAVNTPIEWTFTNTNTGIVITKESKTSDPYGIATVQFPVYMAGHWTYTARWAGNANYIETEKSGSFQASGSEVYWNGYWIQAQSAYYARNYPFYYPNTYYWNCYQSYDYVFIELAVSNAQSGINQQSLYNLYVTTNTGTYSGYEISDYSGGAYSVGMPPGGSGYVWMCFQIPHHATINGLYGQVTEWNTYDSYLGPTSYTIHVPMPSMNIY